VRVEPPVPPWQGRGRLGAGGVRLAVRVAVHTVLVAPIESSRNGRRQAPQRCNRPAKVRGMRLDVDQRMPPRRQVLPIGQRRRLDWIQERVWVIACALQGLERGHVAGRICSPSFRASECSFSAAIDG
jgi:hypothetical protein